MCTLRVHLEERQNRAQICKRSRSTGIDSASLCSLAARYDIPICRNGPPSYIGGGINPRNRFLGSLKVYKHGLSSRSIFYTENSKDDISYILSKCQEMRSLLMSFNFTYIFHIICVPLIKF